MILYFTHESCGTLKSFILFITVKAIAKLNLGHIDKFEIRIEESNRCGSLSPDNINQSFHIVVLQRMAKKCNKNYNACAQPLYGPILPEEM